MDRKKAKELQCVFNAFADGKIIECRRKGSIEWSEISYPSFSDEYEYRIWNDSGEIKDTTTQGTLIPFSISDAHLFRDKWIEIGSSYGGNQSTFRKVVKYNKSGVTLSNECTMSYEELLSKCTFDDGSPCGRI